MTAQVVGAADSSEDPCFGKVTLPDFAETAGRFRELGDIKEFRSTVGLRPWTKIRPEDDMDVLLLTLSSHKAPALDASVSRSASTLLRRKKQLAASHKSASEPDLHAQTSSTIMGSSKFSFGPGFQKPRHLKGKLKIPVLEPRDPEYGEGASGAPGPGGYDIRHCLGQDAAEAGGGGTGGWMAGPHDVFMRVFKDFKYQASPDFFDRLKVLLPETPRLSIVEHVRWYVNYKEHKMNLEHTATRFREQVMISNEAAMSQTFSKELLTTLGTGRKQRLGDTMKTKSMLTDYHAQADAEVERWGLKTRSPPLDGFRPEQHNAKDGTLADGNHRGHPEFKKPASYTWSASNELRDINQPRYSDISHVRSSSHFDHPGPGHYIGLHEQDRLLKRSASYTVPKGLFRYDGGLPQPDMDGAQRNAEVERRLKKAGARKGEITVTIIWSTNDDLELRVVPPGGALGRREICNSAPQLSGGRLDTAAGAGNLAGFGGKPERVESISWPTYLLGQEPPARGEYKAYLFVRAKRGSGDTPWLCRVLIGNVMRWFGGVVKEAGQQQNIYSFKYDEPVDSSTKLQQDIKISQNRQPAHKIGTEGYRGPGTEHSRKEACSGEGHVIRDLSGTQNHIGPGSYTHSTAFHSQY